MSRKDCGKDVDNGGEDACERERWGSSEPIKESDCCGGEAGLEVDGEESRGEGSRGMVMVVVVGWIVE